MRRQFHKLALLYKIGNMLTPIYLTELLPRMQREISQFSLRSDGNFSLLRCRTVRYYESFVPSTIKLWNVLSLDIRNSNKLRSHFSPSEYNKLFKVAPYSFDCTAHNCIQKTIILSSCKV